MKAIKKFKVIFDGIICDIIVKPLPEFLFGNNIVF